jgi:uncharacterized membrane protein YdbT with pleckstrin-like domain
MKYVERVLRPGEQVVHSARLHWLIYLGPVLVLIIAAICAVLALRSEEPGIAIPLWLTAGLLVLIGLITTGRAFILRTTTELVLTDRRVIYRTGLFRRHTMEMNRTRIETVGVSQSIPGRLLNYGTVIVRGSGDSLDPVRNIADPLTFRNHITAD